MILRKNSSDHDGDPAIKREENTDVQIYTGAERRPFCPFVFSFRPAPFLCCNYGRRSGKRWQAPETVPEEGAQTEALWQDPASPHPLEMEVVYGYDNTARSGRILPMTIRVTNSTKEDFTGTLRAATLEPEYSPYGNSSLSEYSTYRYEYPIEVKAGETVEKKIQISLSIQVDQVLLSLVDQEGKETAGRRIRLDLNLDTAELYVGF